MQRLKTILAKVEHNFIVFWRSIQVKEFSDYVSPDEAGIHD